jgi:uncharacterized protein
MYYKQKQLLFPTQITQPVPLNWQPSAGIQQNQALIDGRCGKLHVVIWRTANAKGTIMMFHGNGESVASINDYAYAFHQLNYNLMAWDYPGYGQSSDCWFSQSDLLSDSETAYQWLTTQEDPKKIFLFGYSLGTGLALYIASLHAQNPVYLVAAYDSMLNVVKDHAFPLLPVNLLLRYPLQTQAWVQQIKQPIYLIHGDKDQIILPSHAESLVANSDGKAHIELVANSTHTDENLFVYRNHWLKRLLP